MARLVLPNMNSSLVVAREKKPPLVRLFAETDRKINPTLKG